MRTFGTGDHVFWLAVQFGSSSLPGWLLFSDERFELLTEVQGICIKDSLLDTKSKS